ncbi:hypothetical protein ACFVJH_03585 [Streptomyces decoyicus]
MPVQSVAVDRPSPGDALHAYERIWWLLAVVGILSGAFTYLPKLRW